LDKIEPHVAVDIGELAMPKFLVTYHGGSGVPSDPAAARMMRDAFASWASSVGAALVDPGGPLGAARTVSPTGTTDGQAVAEIGGYSMVEAAGVAEAAALVIGHPFIGRGGTLEVSEVIDLG
jgi:hypothetical protein